MTKVCIYGAGAIGGLIGARLAATGSCAVSAVARGATLAALQQHGWRVLRDGELLQAPCAGASADPGTLGVQDIVVVAVKSQAMGAVADAIAPLIGPHTLVVPAMNGVPWWFAQGITNLGDAPLQSVDPGGRIARAIALEQVLGCVVYASASMPEPGLVAHKMGLGLVIGEPRGGDSARLRDLVSLLNAAGFEARASDAVRQDIWYKLWGNLTMNPISAITGATIDRILDDDLVRDFCSLAMAEAALIGERIGCAVAQSPADRHAVTRQLGAFKSSMLQDVEAQRSIELDAIVGAVLEIAHRLDMRAPNISALMGITRLFARSRNLYPA